MDELKVSIIANPKRNVEWTATRCIEVYVITRLLDNLARNLGSNSMVV
jgi:hypothetical protein